MRTSATFKGIFGKAMNLLQNGTPLPEDVPTSEKLTSEKELNQVLNETETLIDDYSAKLKQCNTDMANALGQLDQYMIHNTMDKPLRDVRYSLLRNIESDDYWEKVVLPFENLDPVFIRRLYELNSKLTMKEVRHCAYILAGMDEEQLAELEGISVKSIKMTRYRLKKRLNIDSDQPLRAFLQNLTR